MIDYTLEETRRLFDVFFRVVEGLDLDGINSIFTAGPRRLAGSTEHFKGDMRVVYRISEHGVPFPVCDPVKTTNGLNRLRFPDPSDTLKSFMYWQQHLSDRILVLCVPGPFKLNQTLTGGMQNVLLTLSKDETPRLEDVRGNSKWGSLHEK